MLEPKGVMEPYREPRGRGLLTLLAGILVFAGFGAVVGYAYFNGLPDFGGEPPVIRADTEPYRRAPDDRGGLEVANASSSIVNVLRPESEPPRVERILPPEPPLAVEAPEPPAPAPQQPQAAPPPEAAPPPPPPPAQAAAPQPAPQPSAVPPPPVPQDQPSVVAAVPPAAPLPTVKPPPAQAAPAAPAPSRPAAERAPAPQRQARVEPAAPTPPVAQRRLTPEPPAAAGVGGADEVYRLQLAAVRTDGGLTQAWAQLKQRYPGPLGTVNPRIERTETTTGPLFRLQAGPFSSRDAASDACGSIRAGGGQCFIVGPVAP